MTEFLGTNGARSAYDVAGDGPPAAAGPAGRGPARDLRAPLLVVLGTLDEPSTTDAMRHLAASVPGARLEEFESAHMVNPEHPEFFNRLLRGVPRRDPQPGDATAIGSPGSWWAVSSRRYDSRAISSVSSRRSERAARSASRNGVMRRWYATAAAASIGA